MELNLLLIYFVLELHLGLLVVEDDLSKDLHLDFTSDFEYIGHVLLLHSLDLLLLFQALFHFLGNDHVGDDTLVFLQLSCDGLLVEVELSLLQRSIQVLLGQEQFVDDVPGELL